MLVLDSTLDSFSFLILTLLFVTRLLRLFVPHPRIPPKLLSLFNGLSIFKLLFSPFVRTRI